MNADQYAGAAIILIAATMLAIAWLYGTSPRVVHPSRTEAMRRHPASRHRIDALIETALHEGIQAPAPDAEVTRRIRAHMDAAVAKLRDDIDEWESA